ncbi:hypothetical protein, partial [Pseudoalteromonas sp. SYSU M81241]
TSAELRGCLVQRLPQHSLFILQVGWVERSETQRVSEFLVSKGKVELLGCLVESHPQQQNPVGGTSVPNLDHNKHIHG